VTRIKFDVRPPLSPLLSKEGKDVSQPAVGGRQGVVLKVYDALGREIKTLVSENLKPGTYEVQFDGTNLPSGVYFYTLKAGDYTESRKMMIIK
jgi:hypothetical protein